MRDGRRNRLGLQTGTEGTVQDTYLDRILTDEDVAGQSNILNLDPDANVKTTDQRYVQDAYNYYLGGGKGGGIDAATQDFTGGQMIDTGDGGGGQATSGVDTILDTGDAPINVDTPLTQMITTPTGDTTTVKEAMTSDDAYSLDPQPITDQAGAIAAMTQDDAYSLDTPIDIGFEEGQVDPGLAAGLEGPIVDTSPVTPTITAPSGDVFAVDDPLAAEKIDFTPETQGLVDTGKNKINEIGQSIADFAGTAYNKFNTTVEIAGKKINLASTAAKAILNRLAGGPVSLIIDALGALGLEGGRGDVSDALGEKYGMDDIGRLTGGPMEGYSVGPDFAQTVQDRIDNINETLSNMTSEQLATTTLKDRVENLKEIKAETIAAGTGGVITEPGTVLGPGEFLPEGEELVTKEEQDAINRVESFKDYEGVNVQGDGSEMLDDAQGVDVETADIQDYADIYEPPAPAPISVPVPAHISGGGGGGGGANIGGGQQTSSGGAGGFSSGQGGGWGWNKGGIVSLKNAKR